MGQRSVDSGTERDCKTLLLRLYWSKVTVQDPSSFVLQARHQLHKDADCTLKCSRYSCSMQKWASIGTDIAGVLNSYEISCFDLYGCFPF